MSKKKLLLVISACLTAVTIGFWLLYQSQERASQERAVWLSNQGLDQIKFSGDVIATKLMHRYGHAFGLACIRMHYSNIDSINIFSAKYILALKIKNGIAVIWTAINNGERYFGPNYTDPRVISKMTDAYYYSVNMEYKDMEYWIYRDTTAKALTYPFGFAGLIPSDMNSFDSIIATNRNTCIEINELVKNEPKISTELQNEKLDKIKLEGRLVTAYIPNPSIIQYGKVYGLACIKLDECNVDTITVFNKELHIALKIKNGMAVIPIDAYAHEQQNYYGMKDILYCNINMKLTSMQLWLNKDHSYRITEYPFTCFGLEAYDMNVFDSIINANHNTCVPITDDDVQQH